MAPSVLVRAPNDLVRAQKTSGVLVTNDIGPIRGPLKQIVRAGDETCRMPLLGKNEQWSLRPGVLEDLLNKVDKEQLKLGQQAQGASASSSSSRPVESHAEADSSEVEDPARNKGFNWNTMEVEEIPKAQAKAKPVAKAEAKAEAKAKAKPEAKARAVSKEMADVRFVVEDTPETMQSAPDVTQGDGQAFRQNGNFNWIRFDNSDKSRQGRREIASLTRRTVEAGHFIRAGKKVHLCRVEEMLKDTRILAPSLGSSDIPRTSGHFLRTAITTHETSVLQVAQTLAEKYGSRSIAAVSAASAYHCGGGFDTGGRHALEEAMCTQSTLYKSIKQAETQAKAADPSKKMYIPVDGVVVSPHVEVFRKPTTEGYKFMPEPEEMAGILSLAMFNRNVGVSDCPVDAPDDEEEYVEQVMQKFRSMLAAAVQLGAEALVVPDVGCGVYANDPTVVGAALGQVLRGEFWLQFREIALTGKGEFTEAVKIAVEVKEAELQLEAANDLPPLPDDDHGRLGGLLGMADDELESSSSASADSAESTPPSSSSPLLRERSASSASGSRRGLDQVARKPPSPPPAAPVGASAAPRPAASAGTGKCRYCDRPRAPPIGHRVFDTCCRTCGLSEGGGLHDAKCTGGASTVPGGRKDGGNIETIRLNQIAPTCRFCDRLCKRKSPDDPSSAFYATCCRTCATTQGGGLHDKGCLGGPSVAPGQVLSP